VSPFVRRWLPLSFEDLKLCVGLHHRGPPRPLLLGVSILMPRIFSRWANLFPISWVHKHLCDDGVVTGISVEYNVEPEVTFKGNGAKGVPKIESAAVL